MSSQRSLSSFRKRLSGRKNGKNDEEESQSNNNSTPSSPASSKKRNGRSSSPNASPQRDNGSKNGRDRSRSRSSRRSQSVSNAAKPNNNDDANSRGRESRPGIIQRLRERSRSRSRSRNRKDSGGKSNGNHKELLVAVTSCRSDGYYNQKAPGSLSKLPRKAPTNLKLFHELAVGVKDAYAAVGATPRKPTDDEAKSLAGAEYAGRSVLWDFIGNVDFLLALVDEVSVDTVTRGALKDDATFKQLRDVIKKGNRVLEEMLVRRERKYTLFFRLVQAHDNDQIERIKNWNLKVEKAVGSVTASRESRATDSSSDAASTSSSSVASSASVSSRAGVFSRGRQLLPTAGRVRSRRATPTPRLRKHRNQKDDGDDESSAADDGFSAHTTPNDVSGGSNNGEMLPNGLAFRNINHQKLKDVQQVQPKDELVDVIRGLRVEKMKNRDTTQDNDLAALKPNWRPKADIPASVPKLPNEYVHRHKLMKQVVSCLLDENDTSTEDNGNPRSSIITCVTSRHGDKAGNGKSTLAIAVIQTVEIRERFPDGIAWLKLGRGPLSDRDIRRLYEDLYRQLIVKEADIDESLSEVDTEQQFHESFNSTKTDFSETKIDRLVDRADSVRRFQGGDLEGIKEDLSRMLVRQKILICLDDVWRVEDAKWFIFDTPQWKVSPRESPYKILITTRTPSLLGTSLVQEVFVRILSEHEAVKLLLSTAGRRPYGGRNSAVFNQSKLIVKGCGNSPLGIMLVGSMLRESNRNWNLNSPVWIGVFNQCSLNLEEAAQLRSFKNAFNRVVDACFFTIADPFFRVALRRCFVYFSMAFRGNDWMLSGLGIPQSVILKFFETIISAGPKGKNKIYPQSVLTKLENLKLVQRARHSVASTATKRINDDVSVSSQGKETADSEKSESDWDDLDDVVKPPVQQCYTMHDSLKAAAELMAQRVLPFFTPDDDSYTYFAERIEEEETLRISDRPVYKTPLRSIFNSTGLENDDGTLLTEPKIHELISISLLGGGDGQSYSKASICEVMKANHLSTKLMNGGNKFEEYTMAFLPEHLMSAAALTSAAEIMTNPDFVRRRVFALGTMEATGRQVADILDLRSYAGKGPGTKRLASAVLSSPGRGVDRSMSEDPEELTNPVVSFDLDQTVCDSSRIVVDEVYKVTNNMGSSDSLGMATCLATVGEVLLKCRQPRDSMLRLEEAVSIYRGLLGPYHVYVAHALHSVAKALAKLGEARVALLKFAEAARIYETCNATLHYDSIQNAHSLATLLVDIGDIRKAESMFEEVINMKQAVYGEHSVPVAKTINSYAILLAKHGRMNDALKNYELAKDTYQKNPPGLIVDPEFEVKCDYDVTLIALNIASIYSKKGELEKALKCYEEGVKGLESYEMSMSQIQEGSGVVDNSTSPSSHKHLVAALGRIGSLKLKLGDSEGALEAYLSLISNVKDDSPIASHTEEAKAHIKCATIYRQRQSDSDKEESVSHLKEALRMYKALHGPDHKDTMAIATSLKQWLAEDKTAGP